MAMPSVSEVWQSIPGTYYEASTLGRIRSVSREYMKVNRWGQLRPVKLTGRILKQWPDANGYLVATICGDGERRAVNVHRLVASAFMSPPLPSQTDVNHVDGNKQNNVPQNLEWCSRKENMAHARREGLLSPYRGLRATPIGGGAALEFESEREAVAAVGAARPGGIRAAAAGRRDHKAHGYYWEWINGPFRKATPYRPVNKGKKLTVDDVVAIRSDSRGIAEIAKQYGVSGVSVWMVRTRRAWRHIP